MPYTDINAYNRERNQVITANNASWFMEPSGESTISEQSLNRTMDIQRKKIIDSFSKLDLPFPPAEPFYKVKSQIEKTILFDIFRKMPKGGQLHMHTSAAATAEWILDTLKNNDYTELPKAYIYIAPKSGKSEYIDRQIAFFRVVPNNFHEAKLLLKDPAFYDDMLDRLTFRSSRIEAVPYIWDEFNKMFALTSELLKNRNFYKKYYRKAFDMLIEDNINYLEMRTGFAVFNPSGISDKVRSNGGDPRVQNEILESAVMKKLASNANDNSFLDILMEIVAEINAGKPANANDIFTLKVILCGNRTSNDIPSVIAKLDRAIELKATQRYSNFIIGFDLVGEEDRGNKTINYVESIINGNRQLGIDYYFHDGESNWAFNDNIIDAYLIGNKRIGHGFNILSYPYTSQQFIADQKPPTLAVRALEICPISNQMLRYTPDLRTHPAYQLMKRGMQCVICNDDPQLFMNSGLSYDFWMIYVAFNLNLNQIKKLILNSYDYSALNTVEKQAIKTDFLARWDRFVLDATAQY